MNAFGHRAQAVVSKVPSFLRSRTCRSKLLTGTKVIHICIVSIVANVSVNQVMQNHAAVFRDGPTLSEGCAKLTEIWKDLGNLKV